MSKILITGSAHGLGKALVEALDADHHHVIGYDIVNGQDVRRPNLNNVMFGPHSDLDVLINCAGVNDIGWLADFDEERWDRVMDTNAMGIFQMTRACLPFLRPAKGAVINIVSNAAHMPMRCSAAYNASKGAALILTKQLARELAPDITVFSVSPNKLSGTQMSTQIDAQVCATRGWTMEEAQRYQLAGLLTGEETPAECVAEFIAFLLSSKERHKYLTGCDIPYGA